MALNLDELAKLLTEADKQAIRQSLKINMLSELTKIGVVRAPEKTGEKPKPLLTQFKQSATNPVSGEKERSKAAVKIQKNEIKEAKDKLKHNPTRSKP